MNNLRRWMAIPLSLRWAIVVWIALIAGVLLRVALSGSTSQSVVPIYMLAGERWWNAEPLYAPPPGTMDVFRNPPGFAALFAPLSQLPIRSVALVYRVLGVGLLLLGLRRFLAAVHPVPLPPRAAATVWIIAAFLALPAFNNGQVNTFIAVAALHGIASAIRGGWWAASGWLMFATWLKGYPIALAGLAALLAPTRLGWRMPAVLIALLAWPFATRNSEYVVEQSSEFWRVAQVDDRSQAPLERTMRGWTYLVRIATGECVGHGPVQLVAAGAGLALASLVLFAARRIGATPGLYARTLVLGLLWMVLFGPATESNTYSILAPVGWLLVGVRLPRAARLAAALGIALLVAGVLRGAFPQDPEFSMSSLQPIGAFLLLGVAVWELMFGFPREIVD